VYIISAMQTPKYNCDWPVYNFIMKHEGLPSVGYWPELSKMNFKFEFHIDKGGKEYCTVVLGTNTYPSYFYFLKDCGSTAGADELTCYYNCLAECITIKHRGRELTKSEITKILKKILAPNARYNEESDEEQVLKTVRDLGLDVYVVFDGRQDSGDYMHYIVYNYSNTTEFNPDKSVILLNIGLYHYRLYKKDD
jgi:hypothetical protein